MPFKSEKQRRFLFAAEARGEVPKGTAKRWQEETPKGKLPMRVKKSEIQLPDHAVDELLHQPDGGQGYQIVDLHLSDGRVVEEVPVLNSETAIMDEDIDPSDIEHVEKVSAIRNPKKLKKDADIIKYTRMRDELRELRGVGLGDSESSSAAQFPYGPEANRAPQ